MAPQMDLINRYADTKQVYYCIVSVAGILLEFE
jgi:hypothetical protein